MLKQPASFVLDSLKSSPGTRPPHHSAARTNLVLLIRRTVRPRGYASGFNSSAALSAEWRVSARRGWAGENRGLFEHPAEVFSPCSRRTVHQSVTMTKLFSRNLSDRLRLAR